MVAVHEATPSGALALTERGDAPRILGHPDADGHPPHAVAAGCCSVVIATTRRNEQRALVSAALEADGAAGVCGSNFSMGTAVIGLLVDGQLISTGRSRRSSRSSWSGTGAPSGAVPCQRPSSRLRWRRMTDPARRTSCPCICR